VVVTTSIKESTRSWGGGYDGEGGGDEGEGGGDEGEGGGDEGDGDKGRLRVMEAKIIGEGVGTNHWIMKLEMP